MMFRLVVKVALVASITLAAGALMPTMDGSAFGGQAALAKDSKQSKVADWFQHYDQIRHEAQMSDTEREHAKNLMTQGIASSIMQSANAAEDKAAATALLHRMVARYQKASSEITQLPSIPETKKLQQGYTQYFQNAGALFGDYLKVQNNLFATDAQGNGLVGQMTQRKADLETLDAANKDLDAKLRAKYGVPAYAW